MSGRSEEQFAELCLRYLEHERQRLAADDDPRPTLLLDTERARATGGLAIEDLAGPIERNGYDFAFYVYMPAVILRERASRWATIFAYWVAREPARVAPSRGEQEASELYARRKYLELEGVDVAPAKRADRFEQVTLVVGTSAGERPHMFYVERSTDAPRYRRETEPVVSLAGRMCEPARQAVRMVADDEVADDFADTFARYLDRVRANVADARRVFPPPRQERR